MYGIGLAANAAPETKGEMKRGSPEGAQADTHGNLKKTNPHCTRDQEDSRTVRRAYLLEKRMKRN
jgi:hypothetical protein